MASANEAGGATNMKRQKTEFKKKKTDQMFNFMVNAFKTAANSNTTTENAKQSNDKKRKASESFAFDDDVFDEMNLDEMDSIIDDDDNSNEE